MNFKIKKIDACQTLPIRQEVMWPNKPIEYVELINDNEGNHFGLFVGEKLISVISLFNQNDKIQFRKFATLDNYQGKGYGTKLLEFIIDIVITDGVSILWCNARVDKANFYNRFGLKKTADYFEKGGIEYVIMERVIKNHCS